MSCRDVLGRRRGQRDGFVEARVAAQPQIFLCFLVATFCVVECAELVIHLSQPSSMRRSVGVLDTPSEVAPRGVPLAENSRKLSVDDPRTPPHDKDLSA